MKLVFKLLLINSVCVCLPTIFFFASCAKKHIDISYSVTLIPLVDTLPSKALIEYNTWTEKESVNFEGTHWAIIKKSRIDTDVTLKATGSTNVKSIEVRIGGYKNQPVTKQCDDTNCSVEARYDLYGD